MSSLKDLASLIMIPSLVKDGRLDTVKPLGNSIIHPDATGNNDGTDGSTPAEGNFTFSRGSNLAATRVDVNGLIEKGRENLLLQSNQFDTTWGKPNSTLTQGFSGYDGSNNAWKWASTAAGTAQLSQGTSGVSGMRTLSIYAKAGSRDVFSIWVGTGIDYNLTTGQTAGHANASMESVGNGWWRCSYFNDYGTLNPYYGASSAGEFIYIMNAQAEQGLVATDYIETGASTAQSGILEDLPRLDYSGGASCPSLLLEPQRSNLVTQSEYFGASQWTYYSSTISSNDSTSPDGLENATRWTSTAAGTFLTTSLFISDPSSFSVFVKYVDYPYILLYSGASGGFSVAFDIENNIIGTSGYNTSNEKIESYGDGWYRISCTFANASAGSSARIGFARALTSTWGDLNTSGGGEVLIYGAQLEAGSYPTSYIPTMGSAVTRSYDSCNLLDLVSKDIITSSTEWTIMFDVKGHSEDFDSGDSQFYAGQNSTIDLYMRSNHTSGKFARFYWRKDSKYIGSAFGKKVIARLSGGIGTTFADGVLNGSSSINGNYDLIGFAKSANTSTSGFINQILIFPTALTDSECIALTTI